MMTSLPYTHNNKEFDTYNHVATFRHSHINPGTMSPIWVPKYAYSTCAGEPSTFVHKKT